MSENAPGFTALNVAVPPATVQCGPELNAVVTKDAQADSRAWDALKWTHAQNASVFVHAVNMGSLLSAQAGVAQQQTGVNANQQGFTPIAQKAADTQVQQPAGAVYPANRYGDLGGSTALSSIQAAMAENTNVLAKLAESMNAILAKIGSQTAAVPTTPAAS